MAFETIKFGVPMRTYRFRATIQDRNCTAQFSNITGFSVTTDVIEYREGNDLHDSPIKMPGMIKYGNVTFKRGMTADTTFITWMTEALPDESGAHGVAKPSDILIEMLQDGDGPEGETLVSWTLRNAWPANLTLPDLNASSSEVAIETLEVVHEGLAFGDGKAPWTGGPAIRENTPT